VATAAKDPSLHGMPMISSYWLMSGAFFESGNDPDAQKLLKPTNERVIAEAKLYHLFVDVIRQGLSHQGIPIGSWHYVVDSIVDLKSPLPVVIWTHYLLHLLGVKPWLYSMAVRSSSSGNLLHRPIHKSNISSIS
jgi:hypothetical protein